MLKAIVSYSKKVPVPDSDYSSQGFSLSLETEVPETEPVAIQARLHQTFEMVKAAVEQELAQAKNGNHQSQPQPEARPSQPPPQRNNATGEKASNKQIKFITDLANQRGIALSEINADVRRRYGVDGLYDLTRKQASEVLDELNGKRKAA